MDDRSFGARLEIVLKALSMSRVRLAAELAVDKSLVGRWVAGTVKPSDHNLSRLTRYISTYWEDFTELDWDKTPEAFGRMSAARGEVETFSDALTLSGLAAARAQMNGKLGSLAGRWACYHLSTTGEQAFIREFVLLTDRGADLSVDLVVAEYAFTGVGIALGQRLHLWISYQPAGHFGLFTLNGPFALAEKVLTGVGSGAAIDPNATPTAMLLVFERIEADDRSDEAWLEACRSIPCLIGENDVPNGIRPLLIPVTGARVLRAAVAPLSVRQPR